MWICHIFRNRFISSGTFEVVYPFFPVKHNSIINGLLKSFLFTSLFPLEKLLG